MTDAEVDASTRFTVLHEHYNETFNQIQRSVGFRDKMFAWLLVYTGAFIFLASFPQQAVNLLTDILTERAGSPVNLRFRFVNVVVWFGLLALTVRYFQSNIHLNRQYKYIHHLENELSQIYSDEHTFTREGKFYLRDYPSFSNWTHMLYTWVFPIFLFVIFTSKLVGDFEVLEAWSTPSVLIILIYVGLIITLITALHTTHSKR